MPPRGGIPGFFPCTVPTVAFGGREAGWSKLFMMAYERIQSEPWDFLVKLDADLSFAPDFFERCMKKFAKNPKLGIGGGLICQERNGQLVCESPRDPAFHVRGATKIYSLPCWEQSAGFFTPQAGIPWMN